MALLAYGDHGDARPNGGDARQASVDHLSIAEKLLHRARRFFAEAP
jgi:hypothetical protein